MMSFRAIHRPGGPDRLDYTAHAIVIGGVASGFGRRYRTRCIPRGPSFSEWPRKYDPACSIWRTPCGATPPVSATIYPLIFRLRMSWFVWLCWYPARAVYSPMNTRTRFRPGSSGRASSARQSISPGSDQGQIHEAIRRTPRSRLTGRGHPKAGPDGECGAGTSATRVSGNSPAPSKEDTTPGAGLRRRFAAQPSGTTIRR